MNTFNFQVSLFTRSVSPVYKYAYKLKYTFTVYAYITKYLLSVERPVISYIEIRWTNTYKVHALIRVSNYINFYYQNWKKICKWQIYETDEIAYALLLD